MNATQRQPEILDLPPYVQSWSAVNLPGFILTVLDNWQRNFGELPPQFYLVACPQAEVNANGGLPKQVIDLTDPRVRVKQFTSCNRLYLVLLILGANSEARRAEIQKRLSWSEGYHVQLEAERARLRFVEAVEETEVD